jgi:hypothetical protein
MDSKMRIIACALTPACTPQDISLRGDSMHATVGSFEVKATISRLTSNGVATECYSIPYEILDIDECSYPKSHPLSANCASGTKCVNTLGSYECACPDGLWGVQGSGSGEGGVGLLKSLFSSSKLPEGACGGEKNTSHCCLHVQRYEGWNREHEGVVLV